MKKLFLLLSLALLTTLSANAMPAKRGLWRTMKLSDGTEVRVELRGDEHFHYFAAADGQLYALAEQDGETLEPISLEQCQQSMSKARHAKKAKSQTARRKMTHYTGTKKGIVILVEYTDVKFKDGHDKALFEQILNGEDYTSSEGFVGSVRDYFKAQSRGQFDLQFDVYGPLCLSNTRSYYGGNDYYGNDRNPEKMVTEAIEQLKDTVDFSQYDWDGDGEVDQVYILYAGQGEANSGVSNSVWPHEWDLENATGSRVEVNGTYINTYGCSSELGSSASKLDGIGSFCHEFSHCLGFPDLYDTNYNAYGMDCWSLMDYGSYNGDGFIPCGYTSYERMASGWLDPIELTDTLSVSGMKALTDGGEAYILYNDAHKDEYYLLENRQLIGWDSALEGSGLLILHVDYDEDSWYYNTVNNDASHQRCSIFHADNSALGKNNSKDDSATDPYPYGTNNSLTSSSKPRATLFNANSKGTKLMDRPITDIAVDENGEVSFEFLRDTSNDPVEEVALYESFDMCDGTGGNNGIFSTGANSAFNPDLEGWEYTKAYGGQECAKFGNSSTAGTCATPSFTLNGTATLTFRAAPWNNDGTDLNIEVNGTIITTVEMEKGKWTDFSIDIEGNGLTQVSFLPVKRLFLDEVKIVRHQYDAIRTVSQSTKATGRVYSISGQYLGNNIDALNSGLYIVDGRKVVKE